MGKETKVAAPANPPVDWGQYQSSTGLEHVTQQDLGIPFLVIVQKGSPEFDKTHKEHATKRVEGVSVGDVVNTISRQIVHREGKDPMLFTPAAFEKLFVEWSPRERGGGIVKSHKDPMILANATKNEKGQDVIENGNVVVTTAYFFGLLHQGTERPTQVVIGLSSTQLKKSRQWLNLATTLRVPGPQGQRIVPPLFSHKYLLSTVAESNEKGSWYGWRIAIGEMNADPEVIKEGAMIAMKSRSGGVAQIAPAKTEGDEPY